MVVRLKENDKDAIVSYISGEPEVTLFIYGDIESFGVEVPPVSLYRIGMWDAIVLFFRDNACVYSKTGLFDTQAVAALIREKKVMHVNGKEADVRALSQSLSMKCRSTMMCRLEHLKDVPCKPFSTEVVRPLTKEDMKDNLRLAMDIDEFRDTYKGKDPAKEEMQMIDGLSHGDLRYGLFFGGKLCSVAGSTACNSQSAMLVGVATRREERGKGYAQAVVSALCADHFLKGRKFICLFWDNPKAWRLYEKLGFEKVAPYTMGTVQGS
ncbi:MAG: GNAT family N-acetyltransferase [Sphaerochaetaceae bacterium]|jgi:predicted GNAT family acetyltransferase